MGEYIGECKESQKHRIVVATDLTQTGDHALLEAVRLAKHTPNAELHVAYVIEVERGFHDAKRLEQISSALEKKRDELREHMTELCAPPDGAPPFRLETVFHVRIGEPAQAIHQLAVDVDADIVVVGTHKRTGVEKLILGSVAEELMRIARLPILIACPKDFSGLPKTERLQPPRPGEEIHNTGLSDHLHLEFVPRTSHISGLGYP